MVNKAALSIGSELSKVASHQAIDGTGDHGEQEQGHGQSEHGQANHESEDREQGCQQVVLQHDVCLSKLPLQ
ncbi:hypothetical protein D3C73_1316670 [compost metagenome]